MESRTRYLGRLVVVFVFSQLVLIASAQNCLLAAGGRDTPVIGASSFPRLPNATQAIITSYKFGCCGNITAWQTFVQRGGGNHQQAYDITFQVWRPSPTMQETGCYSMVGKNRFANISLSDGGLVRETPEPSNTLTVQPGDVVGYYTVSRRNDDDGILIENINQRNDSVWYDTIAENDLDAGATNCLFPVGTETVQRLTSSTSAAPVLSVNVSTFTCQPTPTISPRTSSLPPSSIIPTTVNTGDNSIRRLLLIVAVVVVIVVILVVSVLVVLLLLCRKKRSQKRKKLEVAGNGIDLSNPNYYSSSLSQKHQNQTEKQQGPYIPADEPPATYESLDTGVPVNYANPNFVSTNHTTYAYISEPPGKVEVGGSAEKTFSLGKDAPHTAAVPKNGTEQEGIYHMLEETPMDQSFSNEQDSAKKNGLFELTGYCVPTEEERKAFGSNYEQQYESTSEMYSRLNFFVEDQIYWAPAGTTSGIYAQLASKRYREIRRDQIRVLEQLGSGQFGEVCRALWTVDGDTLELAVKALKPRASEENKVKFLQEAAIMGQFSHSNVIKMYGVVTLGEPVLICLDILANGDLRRYLKTLKLSGSKYIDFMKTQIMFLKFAKDIAAGMDYLSKKNFVHRDLAARNILLNKSLTCKIGDFGLARNLMDETYYQSSGGEVPVKWTAPEGQALLLTHLRRTLERKKIVASMLTWESLANMEPLALLYKKYSVDSDVWSYGMVLFEIWSVAKKPFSTVSNNQVLTLIQKGFCQAPPPGCPRAVYKLMVDCWNPDHISRPSFSKICSHHLQQSPTNILYWNSNDENLSPAVGVCGAPLEEALKLHLDLQDNYKDYDDII